MNDQSQEVAYSFWKKDLWYNPTWSTSAGQQKDNSNPTIQMCAILAITGYELCVGTSTVKTLMDASFVGEEFSERWPTIDDGVESHSASLSLKAS